MPLGKGACPTRPPCGSAHSYSARTREQTSPLRLPTCPSSVGSRQTSPCIATHFICAPTKDVSWSPRFMVAQIAANPDKADVQAGYRGSPNARGEGACRTESSWPVGPRRSCVHAAGCRRGHRLSWPVQAGLPRAGVHQDRRCAERRHVERGRCDSRPRSPSRLSGYHDRRRDAVHREQPCALRHGCSPQQFGRRARRRTAGRVRGLRQSRRRRRRASTPRSRPSPTGSSLPTPSGRGRAALGRAGGDGQGRRPRAPVL